MKVKVKKLHPDATIPKYAKHGDAGLDLTAIGYSPHRDDKGKLLYFEYDTGLAFEIPEGHVGYVFPRSSITTTGHIQRNSVGVIDSGFRNSIKVRLTVDDTKYLYKVGDRVAQIVIMPIPTIELEEAEELSSTERDISGLGSTGR